MKSSQGSCLLLLSFIVFFSSALCSSVALAHSAPSRLIKGLHFKVQCDFGAVLPCVSAKVQSTSGTNFCTYSGYSGTKAEFACPADSEASQNVICSKFNYSGDSQCVATDEAVATLSAISPADLAAEEAAWIASDTIATTTDGTTTFYPIALSRDKLLIEPYFASQAAEALMLVSPSTYKANVENWIKWYLAHVNTTEDAHGTTGTVYKYDILFGGVEDSLNVYDSADSYPAMFFTVLKAFGDSYESDLESLLNTTPNTAALERALGAIEEVVTASPVGLAMALEDVSYSEYSMDNSEVISGLEKLCALSKVATLSADVSYACDQTASLRANFETYMWNSSNQLYNIGHGFSAGWNPFYPYVHANLWPIHYGVSTDSIRNGALWTAFKNSTAYGNWKSLSADTFPHVRIAAIGKSLEGSNVELEVYLHEVLTKFIDEDDRAWPWHVGESSGLIQALKLY